MSFGKTFNRGYQVSGTVVCASKLTDSLIVDQDGHIGIACERERELGTRKVGTGTDLWDCDGAQTSR